MPAPKPITLTQTDTNPSAYAPKPYVVVGPIPGVGAEIDPQAAPTLTAVPGTFADVDAVQAYLVTLVSEIQDIIDNLVASGTFE